MYNDFIIVIVKCVLKYWLMNSYVMCCHPGICCRSDFIRVCVDVMQCLNIGHQYRGSLSSQDLNEHNETKYAYHIWRQII